MQPYFELLSQLLTYLFSLFDLQHFGSIKKNLDEFFRGFKFQRRFDSGIFLNFNSRGFFFKSRKKNYDFCSIFFHLKVSFHFFIVLKEISK